MINEIMKNKNIILPYYNDRVVGALSEWATAAKTNNYARRFRFRVVAAAKLNLLLSTTIGLNIPLLLLLFI